MKLFAIFLISITIYSTCGSLKPFQSKKVTTKSIITMTKNDKEKLATLEITQLWKLDTLGQIFLPVQDKHEVVLTYFQDEMAFKPHVFEIQIDTFLETYFKQSFDLVFLYGMSYMDVKNEGKELPVKINLNGFELKQGSGKAFSTRHDFKFESQKLENGIITLTVQNIPTFVKETSEGDIYKVEFTQVSNILN